MACLANWHLVGPSLQCTGAKSYRAREQGQRAACLSSLLQSSSTLFSARCRGVQKAAKPGGARAQAAAGESERPVWLPGSTPPPYLDGSLPGDFGFDPLGLGANPEDLRWYVQAELLHSRFAMAGVAGILVTDAMRVSGLKDLPVWYEAGSQKFEIADTATLFVIQLILFGFVETKRYMDYRTPGSQGTEDSWFFGLEEMFSGLADGYPGGPLFNPLGLASHPDVSKSQPLKTKELKNGRLAMVAMVGLAVQAAVTQRGPLDNLLQHVADPWHTTVIQTLAGSAAL